MSKGLQYIAIAALLGLNLGSRAQTTSNLPWMNTSLTPEQRADLLISHMTLEQKVEQISNDTRPAEDPANRPPGCEFTSVGRHIQSIPELGIPTVRMINGPTGVRGGDCRNEPISTALPSTPAPAATFNPELSLRLGRCSGDEARLDGHQVHLAPAMNLHRIPYGGRNYEYYSEDPYLSGVMAVQAIVGIQARASTQMRSTLRPMNRKRSGVKWQPWCRHVPSMSCTCCHSRCRSRTPNRRPSCVPSRKSMAFPLARTRTCSRRLCARPGDSKDM